MARHQFAVIALAALALASSFWALLDVVGVYSASKGLFGVEAFEARFDGLRPLIKPHTSYGYVSDNPPAASISQAEYFLTQYTLVPAIIKSSTSEKLNIGNMHNQPQDQKQIDAELAARHLVPLQDYGNGVKIFRNIDAQ